MFCSARAAHTSCSLAHGARWRGARVIPDAAQPPPAARAGRHTRQTAASHQPRSGGRASIRSLLELFFLVRSPGQAPVQETRHGRRRRRHGPAAQCSSEPLGLRQPGLQHLQRFLRLVHWHHVPRSVDPQKGQALRGAHRPPRLRVLLRGIKPVVVYLLESTHKAARENSCTRRCGC
jgi:hypothetical protein